MNEKDNYLNRLTIGVLESLPKKYEYLEVYKDEEYKLEGYDEDVELHETTSEYPSSFWFKRDTYLKGHTLWEDLHTGEIYDDANLIAFIKKEGKKWQSKGKNHYITIEVGDKKTREDIFDVVGFKPQKITADAIRSYAKTMGQWKGNPNGAQNMEKPKIPYHLQGRKTTARKNSLCRLENSVRRMF